MGIAPAADAPAATPLRLPNGDGNGTNGVLPPLPEGTGSTTAQNN